MVLEFSTVLVWLQGIGLGVTALVVTGLVLQKLGVIDSLWSVLAKFVDWIVWAFHTTTNLAPTPIKVGLFVILFSLVGAAIVPVTIGVYGICDSHGVLWRTDDFFEGFSAQTLPGGKLDYAAGDQLYTIKGYSFMAGGPLVDSADRGILSLKSADGTTGDSSGYMVCKATNGTCYVMRETSSSPGTSAMCEGRFGAGSLMVVRYFYSDITKTGESYRIAGDEVYGYGNSIPACGKVDDTQILFSFNSSQPRAWWWLALFGGGNNPDTYTGYVTGSIAQTASSSGALDATRFSALAVKDSFVAREGSGFKKMAGGDSMSNAIQFSCDAKTAKKNVTLYGIPIFDPIVMIVIVIIITIIWMLMSL